MTNEQEPQREDVIEQIMSTVRLGVGAIHEQVAGFREESKEGLDVAKDTADTAVAISADAEAIAITTKRQLETANANIIALQKGSDLAGLAHSATTAILLGMFVEKTDSAIGLMALSAEVATIKTQLSNDPLKVEWDTIDNLSKRLELLLADWPNASEHN